MTTKPPVAYLLWSVLRPAVASGTACVMAGLFVLGIALVGRDRDGWRLAIMASGLAGLLVCLLCVVYDGETIRQALVPQSSYAQPVRITITDETGHVGQIAQFGDLTKLTRLAEISSTGQSLTYGYLVEGLHLYSRGEWERVRAELLRRGMAIEQGRGGLVITRAGYAALRRLPHWK